MDVLGWLLDSRNYMPHGHCYLWQPAVLWLNVGSDSVIAASYFTIPAIIGTYLYRRREEIREVWVPILFASFILLCGFTHVFDVWTSWYPDYRLAGVVKGATALVSAGTAISLLFLMPRAMVLRTPGQLEAEVQLRIAELHAANARLEREVAARRTSEAALLESEERLRVADRRKDEFLATLAHELRNPLAPITNSVAMIQVAAVADPVIVRARDVISRQVSQMVRLIDDLMDVSRITGNRLQLQFRRVVLQQVLAQAVETVQPAATARGHHLQLFVPPADVILSADAARLQQVFVNLLTNSVRYTPEGGTITIALSVQGARADISVTDTGDGISADDMPQIFDMFTRAGTAPGRARGGLGIGLALTRRLVELHDGSVSAASEGRGRGSRFDVSLPLVPHGALHDTTPSSAIPVDALQQRRVLVVDDNTDAADSLAQLLQARGCVVAKSADGDEALRVGAQFRPDVIFMDLGMPILDGWQATERLRATEWGRSVLVIAVSGWAQAADLERSRAAGFDRHFAKPINPDVALQLVAGIAPADGAIRAARIDV